MCQSHIKQQPELQTFLCLPLPFFAKMTSRSGKSGRAIRPRCSVDLAGAVFTQLHLACLLSRVLSPSSGWPPAQYDFELLILQPLPPGRLQAYTTRPVYVVLGMQSRTSYTQAKHLPSVLQFSVECRHLPQNIFS